MNTPEALAKKRIEILALARAKQRSLKNPDQTPDEKARNNPKSLRLAINAKCYDCCCGQRREVTLCEFEDCSLWALRPWQKK